MLLVILSFVFFFLFFFVLFISHVNIYFVALRRISCSLNIIQMKFSFCFLFSVFCFFIQHLYIYMLRTWQSARKGIVYKINDFCISSSLLSSSSRERKRNKWKKWWTANLAHFWLTIISVFPLRRMLTRNLSNSVQWPEVVNVFVCECILSFRICNRWTCTIQTANSFGVMLLVQCTRGHCISARTHAKNRKKMI